MRAIRAHAFGEPDVLTFEQVSDPEPGPGQVLVRIHAVGVNPVETYIRSGAYARKPALPYVPGTDGAGEVEAVGDGVTRIGPGDRVYVLARSPGSTGTYAERVVCAEADVLVVAVGRANMVTADYVKPGAVVVDVGTNPGPEGGLLGDVAPSVAEVAGKLTPVPGGVGPVTTMVLMRQTIAAATR